MADAGRLISNNAIAVRINFCILNLLDVILMKAPGCLLPCNQLNIRILNMSTAAEQSVPLRE